MKDKRQRPSDEGRVKSDIKAELSKRAVDVSRLAYCYECGTCTAACPVARILPEHYNPRVFFRKLSFDLEGALSSDELWLCAVCDRCRKRCPHGIKLPELLMALRRLAVEREKPADVASRLEKTVALLGTAVPFPVSYAWLNLRPSESGQARDKFDGTVIKALRSSLKDSRGNMPSPIPVRHDERVAVAGSGPAGLTAAWELRRMGYPVTVFEAYSEPGGMLATGIPGYRLPKDVVNAEMEHLRGLGVGIESGTALGRDVNISDLLERDGYSAVFLALGTPRGRGLQVEGEHLDGVVQALDLLRRSNAGGRPDLGKKVVVIGGGNVAMDAARTALDLGAGQVDVVCLESMGEMPSHEWEVREASAAGIRMNVSWGPKRILGEGGRVSGVEFMRCVSVFDGNMRFNPSFDNDATMTLDCDTVVLAIGQAPDIDFLARDIDVMDGRAIAVDPTTMETSRPGVFAVGDAVLGPASVAEAVVTGKLAAISMDRVLSASRGTK